MSLNLNTPGAIRFMAWSVAVAAITLDQALKFLMRLMIVPDWDNKIVVLPVFNLVHYNNKGMGFGIFSTGVLSNSWVLIGISLVITLVVITWLMSCWRARPALAYGLIIGGAMGNVIDRLMFGEVFDFLEFHWTTHYWPAFNIADVAIVLGVGLLLLDMCTSRPALPKEEE